MRKSIMCLATLGAMTLHLACGSTSDPVAGEPGAPLPGLTDAQLARFAEGHAMFNKQFTQEEGLGPLLNEARCSSCHDLPTSGGSGVEFVFKATHFDGETCDLLVREGGDNVQQRATELAREHGFFREEYPPSSTGRTKVSGPSLYGLGLVDAIAEETLLALEDPDDADGNGISGRAGRTVDGRVGRFGRKADVATLFEFIEGALRAEMGLTTYLHPVEETINGVPVPPEIDPAPDPEIDERALGALTDYVRFLAPPVRAIPDDPAVRDTMERGESVFREIGCAGCHVPSMETGPNDIAALDRKTIDLYSDFLLHDLGPAFADVCGPGATPSEYRTASLMSLRSRIEYFHDDRAGTLRSAILTHGGEAMAVRDNFARLSASAQLDLIRFLSSL
ncbi:MAG: hypothetical protein O7I93_12275 [Gemmatimonadetes bacterium]|nr:hypothetical protein [Gemmatimonadota bacterium]